MAEPFDPYHKWLGIRDPNRPPNHYRLLGLEIFEDDADVIALAADRQMSHLRTFQTGPHGPLSQRLLNEIAAARVCLLKPHRKADYDARLYAELEAAAAEAVPMAMPVAEPLTPSEPQSEYAPEYYTEPAEPPLVFPTSEIPEPIEPQHFEAERYGPHPFAPAPPPVVLQIEPQPRDMFAGPQTEHNHAQPAAARKSRRRVNRNDASAAMWLVVMALLGVLALLVALGTQTR